MYRTVLDEERGEEHRFFSGYTAANTLKNFRRTTDGANEALTKNRLSAANKNTQKQRLVCSSKVLFYMTYDEHLLPWTG